MINNKEIYVFIEKFPFMVDNYDIFPVERRIDIENCSNAKVRDEKFFAWKLLEKALKISMNLDIKDINFYKENNKWFCDKCNFSITHSNNLVAVSVSINNLGIDLEKIDLDRFKKIHKDKVLTIVELNNFDNLPLTLNKLWTIKEALFKKHGVGIFNPSKINTVNENYVTKKIGCNNEEYFVTVVSDDINYIKYYFGENIIGLN